LVVFCFALAILTIAVQDKIQFYCVDILIPIDTFSTKMRCYYSYKSINFLRMR